MSQPVGITGARHSGIDNLDGILLASVFLGASAGVKIKAAIDALPAGGGVVSCLGLVGAQTIGVDLFAGVTAQKPIHLIFGPNVFTVTTQQNVPSTVTFELRDAVFLLNDATTQSFMFVGRTGTALTTFTTGTTSISVPAPSNGEIPTKGRVIAIFGSVPSGGTDDTTLTADPGSGGTTIDVVSTTGFPSGQGYVKIENEIVLYGSTNATQFLTCTRGYEGTPAAAHATSTRVDRPVYDNYTIRAVTGSGPYTVTTDRNITAPTAAGSGRSVFLGPVDVSFEGVGVIDGNKAATDQAANGIGIYGLGWARLRVARGITFQNWDHGGVICSQSQDCVIDGHFLNMGFPASNVGFSVLFFNGSKRCTALGDYENVNIGPGCDDRTTTAGLYDNVVENCVLLPRTIKDCWRGVMFEGSRNGYAVVPHITGWTGAAVSLSSPQWKNAGGSGNNVVLYGYINPVVSAIAMDSTATDNAVIGYTGGGPIGYTGTTGIREGARVLPGQVILAGTGAFDAASAVQLGGQSIGLTALTSTIQRGLFISFAANDAATNRATSLEVQARTTSGSGSVGSVIGVYALDAVKGAGRTHTNQYAFFAESQTQGGTNYHFFGTGVGWWKKNSVTEGIVCASAALATGSNVGFLHLPSMAGAPTGTPTTGAPASGTVAVVIDTTNSKFMAYIGGTWKGVALA